MHSFKPSGGLFAATTSAGVQLESRAQDVSRVAGQGLLGATNFDIATLQVTDQNREDVRDLGFFLQEEVIFKERLLLTAGIRRTRAHTATLARLRYPRRLLNTFPCLVQGVLMS